MVTMGLKEEDQEDTPTLLKSFFETEIEDVEIKRAVRWQERKVATKWNQTGVSTLQLHSRKGEKERKTNRKRS